MIEEKKRNAWSLAVVDRFSERRDERVTSGASLDEPKTDRSAAELVPVLSLDRLFWGGVLLLAAGLVYLLASGSQFLSQLGLDWSGPDNASLWFAGLTAILTLMVAIPLDWRRLTLERILFFSKAHGPVGRIGLTGILSFSVLLRIAVTGLAALFTLPAVDQLKEFGNPEVQALAAEMDRDTFWTWNILGAVSGLGAVLLLIAEHLFKIKTARWAFFRLPLFLGFAFAGLVLFMSENSGQERSNSSVFQIVPERRVFPSPNERHAITIVRSLFGVALLEEKDRQYVQALERDRQRIRSEFEALKAEALDLNGNLLSLIDRLEDLTATQSREDVCRRVVKEDRSFEDRSWMHASCSRTVFNNSFEGQVRCGRPFDLDLHGNKFARETFDELKTWDASQPFLFDFFQCGVVEFGTEGRAELSHFCDRGDNDARLGCQPAERDLARELATLRSQQARLESCNVASTSSRSSGPQSLEPLQLPALLSVMDGFAHDRANEAVDRAIIWILGQETGCEGNWDQCRRIDREVPDIELETTSGADRCPLLADGASDGSDENSEVDPVVTAPATGSWLTSSVCSDKNPNRADWCTRNYGARAFLHTLLSPLILQGTVISTYLTLFMLVFGRRRSRRAAVNLRDFPREIWRYDSSDDAAEAKPNVG